MKTVRLQKPDGTPAEAWACGECGACYGGHRYAVGIMGPDDRPPAALVLAEKCCKPAACSRCNERPPEERRAWCRECSAKWGSEREAERLARATCVEGYDGWLYDGGRYFESLEHLHDHGADDPEYRPATAWCCKERPFDPSVDNMIESELEGHHEDAGDLISPAEMRRLEDFVAEWAKGQGIVSYEPDYQRYVRVDWSALGRESSR